MSGVTSGLHEWDEKYRGHDVWDKIDSLIDSLKELIDTNHESYDYLRRVLLTIRHIRGYQSVPSLLITENHLDELSSNITSLESHLATWNRTRQSNYWNRVLQSFETTVSVVRGWPVTDKQSLRRAAGALRVATDGLLASSKGFEDKLSELVDTASDQFQVIRSETETYFDDAKNQFSRISDSADSLERALDGLREQVSAEIEDVERKFEAEAEERKSQFNERLLEQEQRLASMLEEWQEEHKDRQREFEETQQKEIDLVRVAREKAEKVVGAIGTYSTASGYQRYANQQKLNANILRAIAILLYVAAFGVLAWSVFIAQSEEDSWKVTVIRASSTASLIAGALYATRESTKHRSQENMARETELKLLAMEPFIAPMSPTSQHELRMAMAQKVFVDQMPNSTSQTEYEPEYPEEAETA